MTSPVTPNPLIHDSQAANNGGASADASGLLSSLTRLFTELPRIILEGVVAFIQETTGIDLSGFLPLLDGLGNLIGLGDSGGVLNFFNLIPQILGGLDLANPLTTAVNVVTQFATGMLNPLAFFANLVGGVVPDHQSPATVGVAQYSADTANAGVAVLNAKLAGTGAVFTDTFNRASATNLGTTDYDRSMSSGSGTWGTDGSGNAVWTTGGSTNQVCLDRVTMAMTTKYTSVSTVLTAPPSAGQFGDNARTKLALRMNTAKNTYVVAIIDVGFVEIGYVNSGTYTRLGLTVSVTQSSGDLWEFRAGTAADDYEFVLLQNNLTVCNRSDTSHLSLAGSAPSTWVSTYPYGALIANAGTVQFGFFTFQLAAPTVQVLTVADRTP